MIKEKKLKIMESIRKDKIRIIIITNQKTINILLSLILVMNVILLLKRSKLIDIKIEKLGNLYIINLIIELSF